MSYDTWLDKPYASRAEEAEMHEQFQQTAEYLDAFQDWHDNMEDSYDG